MTIALTPADWLQLLLHFASLSLLAVGGAITVAPDMHRYLVDQQRWMSAEDLKASRVYTSDPQARGLLLGLSEDGTPMRFAGYESLITIGGPGTGKTQAQVIPNLLTYPGSAFVLDVKDELWHLTAGRRMQFGPVYRFAPTDPSGNTHGYNPFDLVSRDADQAALGAFQAVKESPNAYIFGANSDQSALAPERVVGSAIIDLPRAIVAIARDVKAGGFTARVESFGLKSGVVQYLPNPATTAKLPQAAQDRLKAATDSIIAADPGGPTTP